MGYLRNMHNNFFYWTFLMYKKGGGEVGDREALLFGIIMMSIINSMVLDAIICLISMVGLITYNFPKIDAFVNILICGIINCMIFVRKKRYHAIVYVYDRLKKEERIVGVIIWILCCILSTVLFIIVRQHA